MHRYFIVYKPCNMVSQFVSPYSHKLLRDLDFKFPEGVNAVGRLDWESEGLLILTDDKRLGKLLLHPERNHKRSYVVKVERSIAPETIEMLRNGLEITVKRRGNYTTLPCEINRIEKPKHIPEHDPGQKQYIPYSWLEFILTEGKNRQIRKMCSTVKHRCKRLIRTAIEDLELGSMEPGEVKEMEQKQLFELLRICEGIN